MIQLTFLVLIYMYWTLSVFNIIQNSIQTSIVIALLIMLFCILSESIGFLLFFIYCIMLICHDLTSNASFNLYVLRSNRNSIQTNTVIALLIMPFCTLSGSNSVSFIFYLLHYTDLSWSNFQWWFQCVEKYAEEHTDQYSDSSVYYAILYTFLK